MAALFSDLAPNALFLLGKWVQKPMRSFFYGTPDQNVGVGANSFLCINLKWGSKKNRPHFKIRSPNRLVRIFLIKTNNETHRAFGCILQRAPGKIRSNRWSLALELGWPKAFEPSIFRSDRIRGGEVQVRKLEPRRPRQLQGDVCRVGWEESQGGDVSQAL